MHEVHEYREIELTETLAVPIATLASRSFTTSGRPLNERVAEMMKAVGSDDPEKTSGRRFVIWENAEQGRAIAHARVFVRSVFVGEQEIPVLALATVCSDPDWRGQGLGAIVTRAAFSKVGLTGWPEVSLFQTPVPEFYAKLNCLLIRNRFVNRKAEDPEAYPWRDDQIMIYPSEHSWPAGVVDLNGADY